MNILFICDEYPPGKTGGIGSVTKTLADKLCAQGHKIYVVGLYAHGYGGQDFEEQDHVKVWRLRYKTDIGLISGNDSLKDKIIVHALRRSGILNIDATAQFKKLISLIEKLIHEYSIEVIEMPDWNNFYFNINLKNIRIPDFKIPLIIKMHGTLSYFNDEQKLPISKKMFLKESYIFDRANAICGVSSYTTNYCKKLYNISEIVQVLYNGVEIKPYTEIEKRSNKNQVVFSGSLFYKKGIFSLIKAWKNVVNRVPDAILHVYGKGNNDLLSNLLDDETKKSVQFYGHVNREFLMKQLETADLAVFPSYSETFGLGVVEAMSVGCPVIYTKRSCGPEIVDDHKEGLLVDPDNLNEISDQIVTSLKNVSIRKEMSLAAYEKVKKQFDINEIAKQHITYYAQVIESYNSEN